MTRYMTSGDDTVERHCPHCRWHTVTHSYPELVKRYQDHLRKNHHDVWVRS